MQRKITCDGAISNYIYMVFFSVSISSYKVGEFVHVFINQMHKIWQLLEDNDCYCYCYGSMAFKFVGYLWLDKSHLKEILNDISP